MPNNLRQFMPLSVNDTMVQTFFGDSACPILDSPSTRLLY